MNLTVDPNTNRITTSGFVYDAAGNLTQSPDGTTYAYDSENRLAQVNGVGKNYYGSNGERLYDGSNWYFYGQDGQRLATIYYMFYGEESTCCFVGARPELRFAGRLVWDGAYSELTTDRLGSVVSGSGTAWYAPAVRH